MTMSNVGDPDLQARVTRYTIAKLQRIQFLIPLGLVASTLARRLPGVWTFGLALCVLLAFWYVLRDAIKRTGLQTVRIERDEMLIGNDEIRIPRAVVQRWTFSKGAASLLCSGTTYRLRSKRGEESDLENSIRSFLGAPAVLERRGTPKARLIAGSVMLSGVVAAVSGVTFDLMPLFVIGIPSTLVGFGFFAALSSRRIVSG
jgi:hypothetical protein